MALSLKKKMEAARAFMKKNPTNADTGEKITFDQALRHIESLYSRTKDRQRKIAEENAGKRLKKLGKG